MRAPDRTPQPLAASAQFALPNAAGQNLVAFNVGPDRVAYFVFALEELDYLDAGFAKATHDQPQRFRVVAMREDDVELDIEIADEPFNLHLVQPLGDGILVACARSVYRGPADVDLNARLYDRAGHLQRAFCIGDGIESIQATSTGDIWAAYFDEGVLGNRGWPEPLGSSGLVAWDDNGAKRYEFEPCAGLNRIIDCYALNVASHDDVWLCYYIGFPLVHMRRRRVHAFYETPVRGSSALAIGHQHVLFAGDHDDRQTLRLLPLITGRTLSLAAVFQPTDRDGAPIDISRAVGRGDSLFLVDDKNLYVHAISDAIGSL
ncbi:hypothetical protein AACH06_24840 [Ideonella sp. DXS29W]|uniref:Uncharacterized protein n=1 Tax=Ideonella lacteola TaxID=2984193 RepID=A0ABU9BY73_9BURK